jgi:hypothetical protein
VPALDEVDAVAFGLRHAVVAQAVGRVAVHQHLAGDERMPRAAPRLNSASAEHLVHGGEDHRRGGAVGQQRVEEERGAGRATAGSAGALGREGVAVQPVQQLGAVAGDDVELRAVHMGVDEARQQQPAALVVALQPGPGA